MPYTPTSWNSALRMGKNTLPPGKVTLAAWRLERRGIPPRMMTSISPEIIRWDLTG